MTRKLENLLLCQICGQRPAINRKDAGFDNLVCDRCVPQTTEHAEPARTPLPVPPPFGGSPELIYVAGPLTTSGTVWGNVRRALLIADALILRGHVPFVPHLNAIWAMCTSDGEARREEEWMQYDLAVVDRCDSLYRFPGRSRGGDRELERARVRGLRIYRCMAEVPEIPTGARVCR